MLLPSPKLYPPKKNCPQGCHSAHHRFGVLMTSASRDRAPTRMKGAPLEPLLSIRTATPLFIASRCVTSRAVVFQGPEFSTLKHRKASRVGEYTWTLSCVIAFARFPTLLCLHESKFICVLYANNQPTTVRRCGFGLSFSVGDVGMFFPTSEGNFLAFNVGCPGHFLSKECQDLIGRDEHFRPYYVLGRIIEIQAS